MLNAKKILEGRKEQEILRLLGKTPNNWRYGLDMIKASNGILHRGTIYVHLGRMEDAGLVESKPEPHTKHNGIPRRVYWLSEKGRAEAVIRNFIKTLP